MPARTSGSRLSFKVSHLNAPHLQRPDGTSHEGPRDGYGFHPYGMVSDEPRKVIFGEIACRSPGANMVDLMNFTGDIDLYSVGSGRDSWWNPAANPKERSAAIVFKRAAGIGRIQRITELKTFIHKYRPHIARLDLLPIGARRRDWRQTFLSDGNIVVRHEDPEETLKWRKKQPGIFSSTRANDVTNISRSP